MGIGFEWLDLEGNEHIVRARRTIAAGELDVIKLAGQGDTVADVQRGQGIHDCAHLLIAFFGEGFDGEPLGRTVVTVFVLAHVQRGAHTYPIGTAFAELVLRLGADAQGQLDIVGVQRPIAVAASLGFLIVLGGGFGRHEIFLRKVKVDWSIG